MRPIKIDMPRLGVDLLASETEIRSSAVRAANNIDFSDTGEFSVREGHTVNIAGAGYHSIHHNGRMVLIAHNNIISAYNGSELLTLMELPASELIDFTEYNGHTYITCSAGSWWIPSNEYQLRPVGSRLPSALPIVTTSSIGSLTEGTYTVGISSVDDRAEESAMSILGQVTLSQSGGIFLSGMMPDISGFWRVYLTPVNGEEMYLAEEFSQSFAEYTVTRQPEGSIRRTQHLAPLLGGQFIRGHAGRLYVARGDTLWFSEALRPHLYDPRYGYIKFTGRIRFIEPVDTGVFVADDRGVWHLRGSDPTKVDMQLVHAAKAVRRSSLLIAGSNFNEQVTIDEQDHAIWLSTEGYTLGHPDGRVTTLHSDRVRIADGLEGRSVILSRNGLRQVITLIATEDKFGYGLAIDSIGDIQ